MTAGSAYHRCDPYPRRPLPATLCLAALVFLLHGPSLPTGLFMDDHAHFQQLRQADWSLRGLTDACQLELVGGVVKLWWLPETTLRFFRPVAFGLMKLSYMFSGWSPAALHLASLVWHLVNCLLLMILLRRLGSSRTLAWAVAGLFAIHPAHVPTVQWIACQTELMVTAFLLAATLCFARFRGWPGFQPLPPGPSTRDLCATRARPRDRPLVWAIASLVFFTLALGCRENAVVFPLVVASAEPLVWRKRTRSALAFYFTAAVLLGGYFLVRRLMLGGAAIPPRPYVVPVDDPGFLRFVWDKAWYYLLGEFLLIPCVPIAGLPYFQERPLLFYGLSAPIAVLLALLYLRYWRRPPGLVGLAWLLGFMLPVLPVFASPHHLYLPGIGWALTAGLALGRLSPGGPRPASVAGRFRAGLAWTVLVVSASVFAAGSYCYGLAFRIGQGVEDCLVQEIASAPSGLKDGDTLYVANLPAIGHYARLAVEKITGRSGLRLIPLTWSSRLLGAVTATELTWVDDHTIELRVADERYFAGPFARLIREAAGQDLPDEVDRLADLGFRVRVLERHPDGVSALRFEFNRSLTDPTLHLFWGSRVRWACEVRP